MLLICSMNTLKTYLFNRLFYVIIIFILTVKGNGQSDAKLDKVSHAEPLYLDLVKDLGSRKGEKEFNVGADFTKQNKYNEYSVLAEYEFVPINRLGLEVEADFLFFKQTENNHKIPANKLESLRFSAQYSFFVSPKHQTSLALGYTQIVEFADFENYKRNILFTGTIYNPFFIAAKRWGKNIHTLIYTCPLIEHHFNQKQTAVYWQINTSIHYSIPQTKHLIGIEFNKEIKQQEFIMTIRPQAKIRLTTNLDIGFLVGIPISKNDKKYSSFIRIIYKP